jgi:hypothetical protein
MHSRNPLKLIAISSFICPLMNRGCFIIRLSTTGERGSGASERTVSAKLLDHVLIDPSGYGEKL